jgi:hypothetical protein
MNRVLFIVNGKPVVQSDDGSVTFYGEACVDADGSPRAYHPYGQGLDYLDNAGHPGNWWGIVTDSEGYPVIQGENDLQPGYYVSTTSLRNRGFKATDPRRYVDSEKVPFIVVPAPVARAARGIVLGCRAQIMHPDSGVVVSAVVADLGPASHLGELSIAAARALALNPDPKSGGSSLRNFKYTFWPGVAADGFTLQPLG